MNTEDKSIAQIINDKKPKPNAIALLLDGARGIYIPQAFADFEGWQGISDDMRECLKAGPHDERDLYWDVWTSVLDNATWEHTGHKWHLHQDGDLWAYCPELMSREEKRNFGMDVDPFEYVINLDERGEFKATVYDDKGNAVFSIDGQEIFEDGFMKHKNDMDGLKSHLVDLRIMDSDDKLID